VIKYQTTILNLKYPENYDKIRVKLIDKIVGIKWFLKREKEFEKTCYEGLMEYTVGIMCLSCDPKQGKYL